MLRAQSYSSGHTIVFETSHCSMLPVLAWEPFTVSVAQRNYGTAAIQHCCRSIRDSSRSIQHYLWTYRTAQRSASQSIYLDA